jgi:DNA-binding MarR family transcriptional regulator
MSPYPSLVETDAQLAQDYMVGQLDLDTLPTELRVVLGRLMRRLRREHRSPLTQASVLGRLDRDGPRSIGELAAIESVRPQSMSQTVSELEAEGLIERRPDERDGRRTRIGLTARGRRALDADRAAREGWLGQEIASFSPEEQEILREAVRLLNRLADAS